MGSGAIAEKGWRKGPWTLEEDRLLIDYVSLQGEGGWSSVAKFAGLNRSGKSCRLRWVNYLKPGLKKGQITPQEEAIIFEIHTLLGNKWSTIAKYLPGRTDNEIKNYWRTHFKKKEKPSVHKKIEKRKAKVLKQMKQAEQLPQEYDAKSISSHAETTFEANLSEITQDNNNNNQENMASLHSNIEEDQYYMPFIYQEFPSLFPDTAEDDALWVNLWNLDETQDNGVNPFSKYAMKNQDQTSCFDDISNDLCYAKYMFG